MRVQAYPWASLERLPRATTRELGRARRALARSVDVGALARAATEVLGAETLLVLGDVSLAPVPTELDGVAFDTPDGSSVWVALEPALVSAMLGRVLGRGAGLTAPTTRLDATSAGALAAVLLEIARRSAAPEALCASTRAAPADSVLQVRATVIHDGRPHSAAAWVKPALTSEPPARLAELAELRISLPVVAALGLAQPDELAALCPGDAWLPGAGWWIDAAGVGRAALAAPGSERGVALVLSQGGQAVLGDEVVELGLDVEGSMSSDESNVGGVLTESVLDAPLVVRVEIGAVSMSARDWAALRPGDVIETGKRINEPVVLRVAGREVARGELVEVEGELGVRIRELAGGGTR